MSRIIFNPSTGNIEPVDNVTSPLKPLGEKFKFAETFRRPNAKGGLQRKGFSKAGMAMASNPLLRGTTGPSQVLKAPRGYEGMKAILALENLPEANFLKKVLSKFCRKK